MFLVPLHGRTEIILWWREYFDLNCARQASLNTMAGSLFWERLDLLFASVLIIWLLHFHTLLNFPWGHCCQRHGVSALATASWVVLSSSISSAWISQKQVYSCCCFLMPHRFFTHWFLKIHYSLSPVSWVRFKNDVLEEYLVDFKNLRSWWNSGPWFYVSGFKPAVVVLLRKEADINLFGMSRISD